MNSSEYRRFEETLQKIKKEYIKGVGSKRNSIFSSISR
jgi:hypothetical protein